MEVSLDVLVALVTLVVLEVVLGIDNIIFITILAARLPKHRQALGRRLGIGIAVVGRLILLTLISWIQRLRHTVALTLFGHALTYRSLVLLGGGLFLLAKATHEIHLKMEGENEEHLPGPATAPLTMGSMLAQVALIDLVFSLDSVITAVGIARQYWVMATAIVVAAIIMMTAVDRISAFLERHPSMKMLALSFLVLIGALLVIEGWMPEKAEELHLKNYAYFAMAFSFFVELLNIRTTRKPQPVRLRHTPSIRKTPGDTSK